MGFASQEYWIGVSLPSLLMDFTGVQKQVLFYIVVVHLKIQFFFFPLVVGMVHGLQDLRSLLLLLLLLSHFSRVRLCVTP